MKLYSFQEDGISTLLAGFKTNRTQCLAWYTGAGKTNTFLELCRRLIKQDPKIKIGISSYFTGEIRNQIAERATEFGIPAYKITVGKNIPTEHNLYIFNPQTVFRAGLPFVLDYFVIDEGHAGMDPSTVMIRGIMKNSCSKDTKILLVSATPWDTLALKEFRDIPVLKRPLDQGLSDGLLTDFTFHAEETQITFDEKDFSREGNLTSTAAMREMSVLKSACLGKMKNILSKYDRELGDKVLVICPPGNISEVARTLQENFGGLSFLQTLQREKISHWENTNDNLVKFKNDPNIRFLFVTNKCSVGFDMQNLCSIIDLTMSRNIKVLAQRCGRIARKNKRQKKHYFYVYDQSLMKDRLEWLVATMIDFCLGAYDGWNTRTAKYRPTKINQWAFTHPYTVTLSEVIRALACKSAIKNMRTLSYLTSKQPTKWTLALAKEKMSSYSSRTEMWDKNPALYKWFRHNAKAEMDEFFPLRIKQWNEKTVIAVLKRVKSRKELKQNPNAGAADWIARNKRSDLIEKYGPKSNCIRQWNSTSVMNLVRNLKSWGHIRNYSGARSWISKNGGESKYRSIWCKLNPTKAAAMYNLKPRPSRARKTG